MQGDDDARLCERVRAGDTRAFRVLWERHAPSAARQALRHTRGSAADAEDAVSEAMLALLQALRGGRGPVGNVPGYLAVSVRRAAVRAAVRRRREIPLGDSRDLPAPPVAYGGGGQGHSCPAVGRFDAEQARAAYLALPGRRRLALRLFALEGRSARAVATLLGVSPAAASSLVHRSRESLRSGFLRRHARPANAECAKVVDRVVASLRGRPVSRYGEKVAAHLYGCADCRAARRHLHDVNSTLPSRVREAR
ncbi:sigma-70 family RNA polymerase sigma factor [Streptomyces sp. NPDC050095]|uniref:RNA polymerase sigma factor n=1 Tax=unclassified Streptomyces TaxID=2593676 RepID=UPI0034137F5E